MYVESWVWRNKSCNKNSAFLATLHTASERYCEPSPRRLHFSAKRTLAASALRQLLPRKIHIPLDPKHIGAYRPFDVTLHFMPLKSHRSKMKTEGKRRVLVAFFFSGHNGKRTFGNEIRS